MPEPNAVRSCVHSFRFSDTQSVRSVRPSFLTGFNIGP